jgi:hypothetical protein
MRTHLRSNVVGYVALFFALSLGTAWAVQKNAIKSKHIAPGHVREADLGNGAVTSDKLAANSVDGDNVVSDSLTGADIQESSLQGLQGADGQQGPTGPQGPVGPQGPAGSNATINGVAAGGDLTGTYPNPQLAPTAIGIGDLPQLPGAYALKTTDQNIESAASGEDLELDAEAFDIGNMYTAPNDFITVPAAGTYLVSGYVAWDDEDPDPDRTIGIEDTSGTDLARATQTAAGTGSTLQNVSAVARLDAGETIKLRIRQGSGTTTTLADFVDIRFAGLQVQMLSP